MSTKIEWTNETWNPIIGCSKISDGCMGCYAEKMAYRLASMALNKQEYTTLDGYINVLHLKKGDKRHTWNGKTHFQQSQLNKPFKFKKPTMFFVCSMGDLFHESVPFEWILQVWDVMAQNLKHTFQVLTKRPDRMLEFYKWLGNKCKSDGFDSIPSSSEDPLDYIDTPNHIWIGTTVENQEMANERIPILVEIPAKVRFLSCEPLLSDIYFDIFKGDSIISYLSYIQWVVAGKETGSNSRFMDKIWLVNIWEQCKLNDIPFFDKRNVLGLNIQQYPI